MVSVPVCRATKDCTGHGHPPSCSLARLQAGASRRVSPHLHVFICKMDLVGLWLPGGVLGTQDLATGKSPVNHGVQTNEPAHPPHVERPPPLLSSPPPPPPRRSRNTLSRPLPSISSAGIPSVYLSICLHATRFMLIHLRSNSTQPGSAYLVELGAR